MNATLLLTKRELLGSSVFLLSRNPSLPVIGCCFMLVDPPPPQKRVHHLFGLEHGPPESGCQEAKETPLDPSRCARWIGFLSLSLDRVAMADHAARVSQGASRTRGVKHGFLSRIPSVRPRALKSFFEVSWEGRFRVLSLVSWFRFPRFFCF